MREIFEKNIPQQKNDSTYLTLEKLEQWKMSINASRSRDLYFDTEFGAGMDNYLGDEYIFITDAHKKKLKCIYLPINFSIHPMESSVTIWLTER